MRVVLDTDPGNGIPGADREDALAIGLALRSPEIELEAITVVGGNVPVEAAADCAFEVLDAAGVSDVPIYRGAVRPLVQTDPLADAPNPAPDDPTRKAFWTDVPPPRTQPERIHPTAAAHALVELVNARPGEITVVGNRPAHQHRHRDADRSRLGGQGRAPGADVPGRSTCRTSCMN